jgi:lipopolysaccharide heptosyltransferase II
VKRFLLINPFGIGDVLFTTPVMRALKENYPDSSLGYWCNERVAPLLEGNPRISKIFGVSRGDLKNTARQSKVRTVSRLLRLVGDIRRERFDVAFDFSLDHRYGLLCKMLGIPQRIGFDYKGRGRFLTHKIPLRGYSGKHVIEYYLDLLRIIHITPSRPDMELFVQAQARLRSHDMLGAAILPRRRPLVGIAAGAGASWGRDAHIKHWPVYNYGRLADTLAEELGAQIVLLGDAGERDLARQITAVMKQRPIDLVGTTGLADCIAVMSLLDVLITNDGGPLHMAVALGVKTVSFFGPVDERVYGPFPRSDRHTVLTTQTDCRPCYQDFRLRPCHRQRECICSISVETVYQALAPLLARERINTQ